jgi:ABC-type transporter Mla MlaB component
VSVPAAAVPPAPEPISTTLALPAECLVSGATSLKESLAALMNEPQPVTLDVGSLQRIDTAALQVITAFLRERSASGRAVEWNGSAPTLTTAAHLLGLTSLLNLPA